MSAPNAKRNHAVQNAREYARNAQWDMMVVWIERAHNIMPLTKFQLWGLRKITGPYKFAELKLERFDNGELCD